ncbi:hypothetical protein QAD02_004690 [Eretmocerus hayati]|uniref:Uncharacterized protein n=1 Tax=Eretmocerus hayati TaxID=131215 RepID=A0ACC2NRG5_9HYME|nr:hypothetical protein QAD02_004690 [Eretmocerus hayati]
MVIYKSPGQISPLGSEARRMSRSPRNQRSRSADIDCLKKYTERRVELRRHTEAGETSRWIPFSRNYLRLPSIPTRDHTTIYEHHHHARSNEGGSHEGYSNPALETRSLPARRRTFEPGEIVESTTARAKWLPSGMEQRSGIHRYSAAPIMTTTNFGIEPSNSRTTSPESHLDQPQPCPRSTRSFSADVSLFRKDSLSRWNERYINFADPTRLISYRWMPETGMSMTRSAARRTSEGERFMGGSCNVSYYSAASPVPNPRWMTTQVRQQQSGSPGRMSLDRSRPSSAGCDSLLFQLTEAKSNEEVAASAEGCASEQLSEQQQSKKEDVVGSKKVQIESSTSSIRIGASSQLQQLLQQQQDSLKSKTLVTSVTDDSRKSYVQGNKDDKSVPDINLVSQRLRELYDIQTEAEPPKRVRNPSRETLWFSKSSSEEDRTVIHQSRKQSLDPDSSTSTRRNSQELEFNDRSSNKTTSPKRRQLPEQPTSRRESINSGDQVFPAKNHPLQRSNTRAYGEYQLKRDDEEDKVSEVIFAKVSQVVRQRRTFSDEYESSTGRKRFNEAGTRRSLQCRPRFIEPLYQEPILPVAPRPSPRESRTTSDSSYESIESNSGYNPQPGKRGSIEFKSNSKKVEVSHRRTMSQYEPRSRMVRVQGQAIIESSRPRTPIPPLELEQPIKDFRVQPKTSSVFARQRRNSTRYRVYLT